MIDIKQLEPWGILQESKIIASVVETIQANPKFHCGVLFNKKNKLFAVFPSGGIRSIYIITVSNDFSKYQGV